MKFSFETETQLLPEQIWPLYATTDNWFLWEDDLEAISLNGNFETGTTGNMKLKGQPSLSFILTSAEKNQEFTDKTSIPNVADIYFQHELKQLNGMTLIKYSVEFIPEKQPPTREDLNFAAQIFSDVPTSVFKLIEAAK